MQHRARVGGCGSGGVHIVRKEGFLVDSLCPLSLFLLALTHSLSNVLELFLCCFSKKRRERLCVCLEKVNAVTVIYPLYCLLRSNNESCAWPFLLSIARLPREEHERAL
mmetsp:Transcript_56414/g.83851  ORF Transcript_56414/g.83851 Transcript_56414/m.83851 type:complete len:109 (-) Transcript_56414:33-359(-)